MFPSYEKQCDFTYLQNLGLWRAHRREEGKQFLETQLIKSVFVLDQLLWQRGIISG